MMFKRKNISLLAISICSLLLFSACQKDQVDMAQLTKAVKDVSRNSYFIEIYNNYDKRYYIGQNIALYLYCHTKYGWDDSTYIARTLQAINREHVIETNIKDMPDMFHPVTNALSSADKDEIIHKYFVQGGRGMSVNTPPDMVYEIVQRLLHLNILCKTSCESGYPLMSEP